MRTTLSVPLTIRPVEAEDIPGLAWSGGPAHLRAVAQAFQDSLDDRVALRLVETAAGALIALGGVKLAVAPGVAELWMLSVHPWWQSLGVGTLLIGALESAAEDAGATRARLSVELDNPDAERLYRRLGYVETGRRQESWPLDDGTIYRTECTVLSRDLTG